MGASGAGRDNRRQHYRLRYPDTARPALAAGGREYAVAELSEGGLRLVATADGVPAAGEPVTGVLRFPGGGEQAVAGVVARTEDGEVVVQLADGVDFRRLLAEQRWVMRTFPDFLHGPGDA